MLMNTSTNNVEKLVHAICGNDASDEISSVDRFLGDEAINMLCNNLKSAHHVNKKKVILRGNCIGSVGAAAVGDLMKNNDSLKFLSLEWNQIGSVGSKLLADALKQNRGLTHLDLKNNGINNEGAIALAEALRYNNSLKTLDLRWNQIEDNGALAFKYALLDRNPNINLLIAGNLLTESTNKIIDEWMKIERPVFVEPPLPEAPPRIDQSQLYQNDLLHKEIASLRQQCMSLQSVFADVQRQLDSSSLRVTDLEQQLSREEYRFNHLNENYKQANGRLLAQTEEQKMLCLAWEKERGTIRDELAATIQIKGEELRAMTGERDALKDKLHHSEDENNRLRQQLENIAGQHAVERQLSDNELRQALNRINDMSILEAKLKSENTSLKSANARLTEKVSVLTEELEVSSKEHEKHLAAETQRHSVELEALRNEHRQLLERTNERQTKQLREISGLQTTISQLRTQHSNQLVELEQSYAASLNEMRAEEKVRNEATIRDLKQRLDLVTSARTELESRCAALNADLKTMRAEHHTDMQTLQAQISDMENELQRQRSQNTNLKTVLSTVEADSKTKSYELDDLRKKLRTQQEISDAQHRDLQAAMTEKQTLLSRAEKLEQQCAGLGAARAKEFSLVAKNVLRAVEKEFEGMRVDMKIATDSHNSK